MPKFVLGGGNLLNGTVTLSTAKNTALSLIVAASLGKEDVFLYNIPPSLNSDILTMSSILSNIGVRVEFQNGGLCVNGKDITGYQPPYELVRTIRASVYVAGLLLGRIGQAEVALPGGDQIGSRPVDFHIQGFKSLGAEVNIEHGLMVCKSNGLSGTNFLINRASVGATINIMLAAALAKGTTTLTNSAKEPEVVDTAILLNNMGAKIRGAGTETIRIEGVENLHGCEHTPIPDRIEAGTFLIATAAAGGDVLITGAISDHLRMPISKLREAGAEITEDDTALRIRANTRMKPVDVEVGVFPGFATDLQAPFGTLLSQADGTAIVRETIFDNRFRYVDELRRMGAEIKIDGETAIFKGVNRLSGAPVEATDIRSGVALAIAGLMAEGVTQISGVEHIDRGYERFEEKLQGIGADIKRVNQV
jgi:UDP-N-acetylglucosamine 1-carboxyvinyltransferase